MKAETAELELTLPWEASSEHGKVLSDELREHLNVGEPRYVIAKAADPTIVDHFIQLIGSASAWSPLKIAGTAFLTTLSTLAAKDVYAAVKKQFQSKRTALTETATALSEAAKRLGPNVYVVFGIDIPDRTWGTAIIVEEQEPAQIAYALARFLDQMETISTMMQAEMDAGRPPLGRAKITIEEEELVIRWLDQKDLKMHERRLSSGSAGSTHQ